MNMSRFDFLVLVLQRSNSFKLNAFFQVLFSFILTVCKGHIQLLFSGAVCSTGLFGQATSFFYFSFVWNHQTVYTLKPIFSEGPSFLSREKRDIAITFVCLFVCLFVSRISHKLLVGFWWNLVSREVMIIGRPSSKLGVIRIQIRIWDPNNCFSWTTGRILIVGKYSQSFSAVVAHTFIQLIPTMTCARVDEWYICESREMEIVGSIPVEIR